MNAFHTFSAWFFFHDVVLSPCGVLGVMCMGGWVVRARRAWQERRRIERADVELVKR